MVTVLRLFPVARMALNGVLIRDILSIDDFRVWCRGCIKLVWGGGGPR